MDSLLDNTHNEIIPEKNTSKDDIDIRINNIKNDEEKMKSLQDANNALHINNHLNKIIFIYSKPKVGSTSLVTSLRIFASTFFNIIHIHDEQMLTVLGNIRNITVNEIILYNKIIGKEVYVIDVYRSPIERKISTFFEKINTYHFNVEIEKLAKYNIECIIERFNKLFPHIGNGDNFLDIYGIDTPNEFPHDKKYICLEENGIKYIKLRLKDSHLWETFLRLELKIKIKIIPDYETIYKPVQMIYTLFKKKYRIPVNYLKDIDECPYLNYYYSLYEKNNYLNDWYDKTDKNTVPFTPEEFKIYNYLSNENANRETIVQLNHYLDEGCICKACQIKRNIVAYKIIKGETIRPRIFHNEAKTEFIERRIQKINEAVNTFSKKNSIHNKRNDIINGMKNIVELR
jgi:hypothetical protein